MRSGGFAGIAAAAVLLAAAPSAMAETFCVEKPSCNGTNELTLQDAITAAGQTQGIPDRIELGSESFEEGPYVAADDNPVKIVGSGRTRTTLSRSTGAASQTVLTLDDPDSSVGGLAIDIGDGNASKGLSTHGLAKGIVVESTSASTGQIGVILLGGSLKGSTVELASSADNLGISMGGASVSDTSVQAPRGIQGAGEVIRARVLAVEVGIASIPPELTIDQATVEVTGTGSTALLAGELIGLSGESVTARHVTLIGDPTDGATGAAIDAAPSFNVPSSVELVLRNSLINGFATDLLRNGNDETGCVPLCPTAANFDVAWTVFEPGKVSESGGGSYTFGKGNVNKDPKFVKPEQGNYHLKASSKLIDAAQKAKPAAGESKVDLDGRKRVVDGDGDGKARRDYGAFERPKP
jgi:hypothetical protein